MQNDRPAALIPINSVSNPDCIQPPTGETLEFSYFDTPPRCDDRGNHEGDRMAAALRARLLRGRGAQEAGIDAGLGESRG
jgi:hypothetical protein